MGRARAGVDAPHQALKERAGGEENQRGVAEVETKAHEYTTRAATTAKRRLAQSKPPTQSPIAGVATIERVRTSMVHALPVASGKCATSTAAKRELDAGKNRSLALSTPGDVTTLGLNHGDVCIVRSDKGTTPLVPFDSLHLSVACM